MSHSKIVFHSLSNFELKSQQTAIDCLFLIAENELRTLGDIGIIFCDDDYLHKINLEFLKHDTYTDVVTFDYCVGDELIGEIYISTERVEENAKTFNQAFEIEILRVIIHGLLHLCGYTDASEEESRIMRDKENHYLSLIA